MSNALESINTLIRHEQWTRDTKLFTKSLIKQLDNNLAELSDEDALALLDSCNEQLTNNKNNLCALYASGVLQLRQKSIKDETMMHLIDIIAQGRKWDMVEHLCQKLLTFNHNVTALRHLATVYETTDNKEKLVETWELIIQEDFEEADIALKLANHKKETFSIDEAIKDYKKALNRFLAQKNFSSIREIWAILTAHDPNNTDFYLPFVQKAERALTGERAEELLVVLLEKYIKQAPKNYGTQIMLLKRLLKLNPEHEIYRTRLVETYKKKYSDNPKLDDFIRMSNISQNWRNVHEAISDFEKHISFFPGSFVHHTKWGIGRIKEADHQSLLIDFAKKREHTMDISMAVSSLTALPKTHFWVLRSVLPKDKLREKILNDPLWCLKTIIKSFGSIDLKTIKSELVPGLLTTGEWSAWSTKAKRHLENENSFGILPEKTDHYVFSETPVSKTDKVYILFKKEEKLVDKVKIIRKALTQKIFSAAKIKKYEDTDVFWQTFDYFNNMIKSITEADNDEKNTYASDAYVHALFLVNEIAIAIPSAQPKLYKKDLNAVIQTASTAHLKDMLNTLSIREYKDTLFARILEHKEDWKSIFTALFPHHYTRTIIEMLERKKEFEFLEQLYIHLQNNFQNSRNAFIWFISTLSVASWLSEKQDQFKDAALMLRACISLEKDIQNKTLVPQNKRLLLLIENYLFEDARVKTLLADCPVEDAKYLYSLISQLNEVMPNRVLEMREIIQSRFPNFVFNDTLDADEASSSSGFFTLESSFKKKQAELQRLHEVEVPSNSKEIEKARAFGDLRENAEYKAALEQQNALNNRAATLQQEINEAKFFDFSTVADSSVVFGTKVTFENFNDGSEDQYIILGPWESQPSKNIISYLAPIGKKIYRKKIDDICEFSINNTDYKIRIKAIELLSQDNLNTLIAK